MTTITERVIEYLKWHPNARPAEIAEYLGVSIGVVRAVLTKLRQRGIVIKTDRGYSIRSASVTDIGQKASESPKPSDHEQPIHTAYATIDSLKDLKRSVEDLKKRVDVVEQRMRELERTAGETAASKRGQGGELEGPRHDVEIFKLFLEAIDLIKMCLQAIAVNDISSLNSMLESLDVTIDSIRGRIKRAAP